MSDTTEKFFLPSDALEGLREGSHEEHMVAVDRALRAAEGTLFEESTKFGRIATFPDHVVVASDDGRFMRVWVEESEAGLAVSRFEEVRLPVVEEENVWEHIEGEIALAVCDLVEGDAGAAFDRLLGVAPLVPPKPESETDLVEALIETHLGPARPWMSLLEAKKESVEAFVQANDLGKPLASESERFQAIAGKTEHTSVVEYANKLVEALDELATSMGCSWKQLSERATLAGGLDASFEAFGEDLALNLGDVRGVLRDASRQLQESAALSRLCDATREALPNLVTAVQFIEAVEHRWEAAEGG